MLDIETLIAEYQSNKLKFKIFMDGVKSFFELNENLHSGSIPAVHSVKSRLKSEDHLRDKLQRKSDKNITEENLFEMITDLAGVRVLHLYQHQFVDIHKAILSQIDSHEWVLGEDPVAYSWDPEAKDFFEGLDIETEIKDSYYTSVHYLIKPNNYSPVCCELQVRTLFEEIWGEIDHSINYPHPSGSLACTEELRVLSKLISTGTRLTDAIFKTYSDYLENK